MLPSTRADKIAMIRRVIRREPIVPEFTDGATEVTYRFVFGKGETAKDAAHAAIDRITNALPFSAISRIEFYRDGGWGAEVRVAVGRKNMRLHAERYEAPSQFQIAAYNTSVRLREVERLTAKLFPQPYTTGPRAGQWFAERARRRAVVRAMMNNEIAQNATGR